MYKYLKPVKEKTLRHKKNTCRQTGRPTDIVINYISQNITTQKKLNSKKRDTKIHTVKYNTWRTEQVTSNTDTQTGKHSYKQPDMTKEGHGAEGIKRREVRREEK